MCSVSECKLPSYGGHKECILHCEKTLSTDDNQEECAAFQMGLARYLAAYLCGESKEWYAHLLNENYSYGDLVDYFSKYNQLLPSEDLDEKDIRDALRKEVISLPKLHFPAIDAKDNDNDYLPVLGLFGGIKFQGCHFIDQHDLVLPQTGCFFEGCYFKSPHLVESYPEVPKNEPLPIYRSCHFYNDVGVMGTSQHKQEITRVLFEDCFFEGVKSLLQISHCIFNESLFSKDSFVRFSIELKEFEVENCTFNAPFVLNECITLDRVFFKDCEFEEKFEFKHNLVKVYEQENCNVGVDKVADFFDSFFKESFHIEKSIFKGFVGFEKCIFGEMSDDNQIQTDSSNKKPALFKHVTFLDFANFRHAKFFHGLDIGDSNFKNPPNFLNAEVDHCLENTSRETYRIIKHSFDDVGNYLEANKVFALEMERNKYELKNRITETSSLSENELKQIKSDLIIFKFNQFFSDFGQSWKRPFGLIVALVLISQFFYCGLEDVGAHNSAAVSLFCEFSDVIKDFLCNNEAGWFVLLILISSVWAWFYRSVPIIFIGLLVFGILLKIIGVSFPISTLLTPLIDVFNHAVELMPPFNKLLVEGHEFISFVINILFAVLIWQLVVAVKRLTRR